MIVTYEIYIQFPKCLCCLLLVHIIICIDINKLSYILTVLDTLPDKPGLPSLLFCRGQIIHVLGSVGHSISVIIAQLCHCST